MTSFLDRLFGRPEPPSRSVKAVVSTNPWDRSIPLTTLSNTPQKKAAAYLSAYRVGWFSKAGRRIAGDVSSLDFTVSEGDAEEGDTEAQVDRPDMSIPFERLGPIDQFQRLLEAPYRAPNGRVLMTGRQLLHKTTVHLDFAGNACWYLAGGTLPDAILPISPARMWPSRNKQGELIGWVMDKDSPSGGVPFDVEEILWFSTGSADDDVWGTSVVESVYSQVPITDLMARHTATVLTTGGRLAGMLWPKERSLNEDEFLDAQRAYRNVVSDPDAGRRMLIFPEPMEYAAGASTPAELGIPELATLNRDEILTAFPISPYMLGVPEPGGLNSGETRREDRRDYWEGTIEPRADLIEETIQVGLLTRYEAATGQTYDFELALPRLDDAETLKGKAGAFKELVAIGLDPKESIKAVGLAHIKWTGLPELIDPAAQAEAQRQAAEAKPSGFPKAAKSVIDQRERLTDELAAEGAATLGEFFTEQAKRVAEAIRDTMPASKAARSIAMKADPRWWDGDYEDRQLETAMRQLYVQVGRAGLQMAADDLGRFIGRRSVEPVVADLLQHGGARIKDINARTLQAISIELAEGTRRGYSIPQLIDGVPDEGFRGVLGVTLDNGTPVFGDTRAETIARTETRASFNRSAVHGYKELGVEQFVAYDGDDDPECAARNGQTYSVDDALAEDDLEHPNGTLTFSPVV